LGLLYECGDGTKPNKRLAKLWLNKAAKQGYKSAKEALKQLERALEKRSGSRVQTVVLHRDIEAIKHLRTTPEEVTDANGRQITYREYDVHPHQQGVIERGRRIVRGSDGSTYYTKP
jgi:TPR repeat protein